MITITKLYFNIYIAEATVISKIYNNSTLLMCFIQLPKQVPLFQTNLKLIKRKNNNNNRSNTDKTPLLHTINTINPEIIKLKMKSTLYNRILNMDEAKLLRIEVDAN